MAGGKAKKNKIKGCFESVRLRVAGGQNGQAVVAVSQCQNINGFSSFFEIVKISTP